MIIYLQLSLALKWLCMLLFSQMIFVNFKTYEQGTGVNAIELTRKLEEVASEKEFKVIPVVQAPDIREVVQVSKLQINFVGLCI